MNVDKLKYKLIPKEPFVSAQILSSQHCSCIMTRQKKIWEGTVLYVGADIVRAVVCVLMCEVVRVIT